MYCNNKKIKIGAIGTGKRGTWLAECLAAMPDTEIAAVYDVFEDNAVKAASRMEKIQNKRPDLYTDYKRILGREDIDAVLIATTWLTHIPISIEAMKAGKYVGCEVGGANSIEECWELVKTSEETGIPCMLLENCNYGREEMAILNMVKLGVFGEIVHCQCGYEHDWRTVVTQIGYRTEIFRRRNGNLYPTHGLGPIAKILNINRGNRMVSLTAMSSKSRGLNAWARENLGKEHISSNYPFNQGDVVTTMIKCAHGETILHTFDTCLPRPYSRDGRVQGTKGIWMEDNRSVYLDGISPAHQWEPFSKYIDQYDHPLWKEFKKGNNGNSGHGGMDWLVLRAFAESVINKTQPPIDVYDMATLMSITPLTEQSIQQGGQPVSIPDFTNGRWLDNTMPKGKGKYALDCIDETAFD